MTAPPSPPRFSCDIFCRVVDNFGDIGVCWRLARQLASEFAVSTRLIVDDLESFNAIAPELEPHRTSQTLHRVEVIAWNSAHLLAASDCVIEAFACEIPRRYLSAMARRTPTPVWINLEYLSAEEWVEAHHLMPSPHPRLPLVKTFFFPGFTAKTGGLLRTRNAPNPVFEARLAAPNDPRGTPVLGLGATRADHIYFLGYPNQALPALLDAMGERACLFAAGPLAEAAAAHTRYAATRLRTHAFVAQEDFDDLLRQQDICFVRGEDSFVRVQLLGKPFIWQIYPQADDTHLGKLNAFLARYGAGLTRAAEQAMRGLWLSWNREDSAGIGAAWREFVAHLPEICDHAEKWAVHLAQQPDLATNLVNFVVTARAKTAKI